MSKIFVDQVDPKTATTLPLGTSGDTVSIPTGVTLSGAGTITASAANLAASGAGGVTGILPAANGGVQTFSGARGLHSTTQSVGTSDDTVLAWNAELYDTDGYHDTTTNNSRMTIPSLSGSAAISYVLIQANVFWQLLEDAEAYEMRIFQNGTSSSAYSRQVGGGNASRSGSIVCSGAGVFSCTAGDYFQVCLSTNATGSQIESSDNGSALGYFASFNIMRIG